MKNSKLLKLQDPRLNSFVFLYASKRKDDLKTQTQST